MSMKEKLKALPKRKLILATLLILVVVAAFFAHSYMLLTHHIADIFNNVVAKQKSLRGKITAEGMLFTSINRVHFTDLLWEDENGEKILQVPEGSVRVSLWDLLVNRKFTSTTISTLEFERPIISVALDQTMTPEVIQLNKSGKQRENKVDHNSALIRQKEERKATRRRLTANLPPELSNESDPEKVLSAIREMDERRIRFNRQRIQDAVPDAGDEVTAEAYKDNKRIKCRLIIHEGNIEVKYDVRSFIFDNVNADIDLDTHKKATIDFSVTAFGGTLEGDGMRLSGSIDFTKPIPQLDMGVDINKINPASLGSGINVYDPITVRSRASGDLPRPIIKGTVLMDQLKLPDLLFKKVNGQFHYEDGLIIFPDVKAVLYKGDVSANGFFNIDNKHYSINALGTGLSAAEAAHRKDLSCKVNLDLKMRGFGTPKSVVTFGYFRSSPGSFLIFNFKEISADFFNLDHNLRFTNVVIASEAGNIEAPEFSIDHGKLKFGPIYYRDPVTQSPRLVRFSR